ncbi:NAD-dependent epimerase/dehydratase family protein [Flavihumibacter rivuli]|uniref:NAD-dependent epimerase/dehydratase family protein n=1 Tax=Flavihumibacter rivuli TaxID=2838156 RepID=UPI001BDE75EA|nr:NAD-dependent epimerase/dehydratase family protein [Flavihumibacter rivuli]ULQ57190.1 NAD-dependent epimerase/dehydratase family protein [Flavihumibacter rivuli]
MQTILGSTGPIGTVLARELNAFTTSIRLVSREPKPVNGQEELVPANLLNAEEAIRAVEGSSITYLCVGLAYNHKVWQESWPLLIRNVLHACEVTGSKLVFFDNVYAIGGDNVQHITESSPYSPSSRKGQVRQQLDELIMEQVERGKLTGIIARSADFYGPGGQNSFMTEMVYKSLKKGKKAQWFCRTDKVHSFTYVPDAAKGMAMLGNHGECFNQVWNLPTHPARLTGQQWIELFASAMGRPAKSQAIPVWMLRILGLFIPILKEMPEMCYQYDRDYFFDSAKFNRHFQFSPTTPEEGVKATVASLG